MKYLSLFSGIGGFELGIQTAFPNAECLGYSEIDKSAMKIYKEKFPRHPPLGDVKQIDFKPFKGKVDLVVGGSPCKDLSKARCANKAPRLGLEGKQSSLFHEFVRCLTECQPKFFILENVGSMSKTHKQQITDILAACGGLEPILINSANFTAQTRKRLFWTNFQVNLSTLPECKTTLQDVINECVPKTSIALLKHETKTLDYLNRDVHLKSGKKRKRIEQYPYYNDSAQIKSKTVGSYNSCKHNNVLIDHRVTPPCWRRMIPNEYELFQGFPKGWTEHETVSDRQRIIAIGNAVTPSVITWLCQNIIGVVSPAGVKGGLPPQ